mgnify:CR=1 FL=1
MRLGVIGDIHLCFDEVDVRQLAEEGYDAILVVGDLAAYSIKGGLGIAKLIASLSTPTFVMPGNHDAAHVGQRAAEVLEADALIPLLNLGQEQREADLAEALHPAQPPAAAPSAPPTAAPQDRPADTPETIALNHDDPDVDFPESPR